MLPPCLESSETIENYVQMHYPESHFYRILMVVNGAHLKIG